MKFIYPCDPDRKLKIIDGSKFGNAIFDQTFFPKIINKILGEQEHIILHYRDVAKYLGNFITEKEIKKTDIDGMIIPIQHGDMNEILNIRNYLEGKYRELENAFPELRENWNEVDRYQRRNDDYWNNSDYKKCLENATRDSHKVFRNAFKFPIFEAYKHLPGHRDTPTPTDLIDKPVPENLDYVKAAFQVWINRNFISKK